MSDGRFKYTNGSRCEGGGGKVEVHQFAGVSSVAAKTILITNNYTNGTNSAVLNGTGHNSSITIVASPPPTAGINICINNHYDGQLAPMDKATEKSQKEFVNAGASSSSQKSYYHFGDDVFYRNSDGQYVLGTIQIANADMYMVKFDDGTKSWAKQDELRRFGETKELAEYSGPVCVVCKELKSKESVKVCENCRRGYHSQCDAGEVCPDKGLWYCSRCPIEQTETESEINEEPDIRQNIKLENLPYNVSNSLKIDIFTLIASILDRKSSVGCISQGK